MCVAALAWSAHPRWRLVAIGNRDEYHDRPAAPLGHWDDESGIVAGRDLRSGGTWMGVTPDRSRFALITNLRGHGDPVPGRTSRGALVTDMLTATGRFGDPDTAALDDFNPFNLLLATRESLLFLSNRPESVRATLGPGIYGLSNGLLDEPWPKTLALKAALLDWLASDGGSAEPLFAALASKCRSDIGLHPASPSDVSAEPRETAPFILDPVYGTRCSTVIMVDAEGYGTISERRYSPDAALTGVSAESFFWPWQT